MRLYSITDIVNDRREKRLLADRRAAKKRHKHKKISKENKRQDLRRKQDQRNFMSSGLILMGQTVKLLSKFTRKVNKNKKLEKQPIPHIADVEFIKNEEQFHLAQVNLMGILTLYDNNSHKVAEKLEANRIEIENLLNYEFGDFKLQKKLAKRINNFASLTVSLKDTSTKAYNRYYLEQRTKQFFSKNLEFIIYYLDLNQFKEINKIYGYTTGDNILINFVRRLNRLLNNKNFIVRLGGDKFVIVQLDNSEDLTDSILNSVNKPFNLVNIKNKIKISTAISSCSSYGFKDINTMLQDVVSSMPKKQKVDD